MADQVGIPITTNFIEFVELAILAGKQDDLVSAIITNGKSEFFLDEHGPNRSLSHWWRTATSYRKRLARLFLNYKNCLVDGGIP